MSDVNLKFNKPELNVTIDREKQSLGISVIDIAQTLQLSLSGQRFGYFMKKENNTKSLDSLINKIVQNRWT
jgi:HAE1 family hydrophobic/amphiphilic exporter-1/multidrug efflux pump